MHSMNPLKSILAKYRAASRSGREKGTCFEELIRRDSSCWKYGSPAH